MSRTAIRLLIVAAATAALADVASAGPFRRSRTPSGSPRYTYCPTPTVYQTLSVPSTIIDTNGGPTSNDLTGEEEGQLQEMIDAGFISEQAQMDKYKAAATAQRKEQYEAFKKEVAVPTAAELDQFFEMVKAGGFKAGDLPAYAVLLVSKRKEAYDAFKKTGVTTAVSTEELAQFLEMIKGNAEAKKGGLDLSDFATYQKLTPAVRKAWYEAWKK